MEALFIFMINRICYFVNGVFMNLFFFIIVFFYILVACNGGADYKRNSSDAGKLDSTSFK